MEEAETVETYFVNVKANPTSGQAPFNVQVTGYLSVTPTVPSEYIPVLNGLTIVLWQKVNGVWNPTAITANTVNDGAKDGYFTINLTIPDNNPYDFELYFNGYTPPTGNALEPALSLPFSINGGWSPLTIVIFGSIGIFAVGALMWYSRRKD